jgi:hypothetical protein
MTNTSRRTSVLSGPSSGFESTLRSYGMCKPSAPAGVGRPGARVREPDATQPAGAALGSASRPAKITAPVFVSIR